jgi:acetyl/propionyl-CoA carboxylase alpha subunit
MNMKIKSLLIANRGEIAVRIIQTAKMGIETWVIKTSKNPMPGIYLMPIKL